MTDKKLSPSAQGEPDEKNADPPLEIELSPDIFSRLSPEELTELEEDWHEMNTRGLEAAFAKTIDEHLDAAYEAARVIRGTLEGAVDYLAARLMAVGKAHEEQIDQMMKEQAERGEQGDPIDDDIPF